MKNESAGGSNPRPHDHYSNALTTRLPTAGAESTENFCYLCTDRYCLTLLMYTVCSPDPNPREGCQLPDPNEFNSMLTSARRGDTLTSNLRGHFHINLYGMCHFLG